MLKGYIDFESEPWPLISDSAKDLIRKMLCSRPKERLSAHEVLCMFRPSSCFKLFGEEFARFNVTRIGSCSLCGGVILHAFCWKDCNYN